MLKVVNQFVNLRSNSALLYNKGHIFEKVFRPEKFPKTDYFALIDLLPLLQSFVPQACKQG